MRMIDANLAMKKIREYMEDFPNAHTRLAACRAVLSMLGDETQVPTLTPPNAPLSIEQLREMDGEPVWDENGKCYLVDTTYRFCSCSDIEIAIVAKNGEIKRYPQRYVLYRRPPEGEEET